MTDFEFQPDEDGSLTISNAIHQALGAASMAWHETPQGVFDSERATEIGARLLDYVEDYIRKYYDPELEGVVAEGAVVRVVDYRQNLINIADQIENELVPALRDGGLATEPVEDGAKMFRSVIDDLEKVLADTPLTAFAVVAEDERLGGGRQNSTRGAFGQEL